ncbi:MAG: MBL fold metallo-hydrolase [Renibacterium sp.]|nr:MBL fold metallo-hydrolase [Renibacterium sp.]
MAGNSAQKQVPYVVTLGTAGGPRWWQEPDHTVPRAGIATAVVVGDSVYLVDCGDGTGANLARSGLGFERLRGIFLTHLHSDHVAGLGSLLLFGLYEMASAESRVQIYGPGNRGGYPGYSPEQLSRAVGGSNPTPGTEEMVELLVRAHAADLNERILDSRRARPDEVFAVHDIPLPEQLGFDPETNPTPSHEPFVVFRDDAVTVSAVLVRHPPVAPAFAFRFDTAAGSVTISGDTAACENVVALARDCDLLLHEAIDLEWVQSRFPASADQRSEAARSHHLRAHTSVAEAVDIAQRSNSRQLALHHLVPGNTPRQRWLDWASGFPGRFHVPSDLEVIPFGYQELADPGLAAAPGANRAR